MVAGPPQGTELDSWQLVLLSCKGNRDCTSQTDSDHQSCKGIALAAHAEVAALLQHISQA